jgi:hypothetical protein
MATSRIVHFFDNSIFTADSITMMSSEPTPDAEQYFVIWGGQPESIYPIADGPRILSWKHNPFFLPKMLVWLLKADAIVIHGLFNRRLLILWLAKFLPCKVLWAVWGGDLHAVGGTTFKRKLSGHLRRKLFHRVDRIAVLSEHDHENFVHLTGKTDLPILWSGYPNPISLDKIDRLTPTPKPDQVSRILIGNSASASNQHSLVFEKLAPLAGPKVEFIVPLGYGDAAYRATVVKRGQELLGDSFKPLLQMIPIDAYIKILGQIDAAIFYMTRQQALSNIYGLTAMGKKVFLNPDSGMIEHFHAHYQVDLWNFDEFLTGPLTVSRLCETDPSRLEGNRIKIRGAFENSLLRQIWRHNISEMQRL